MKCWYRWLLSKDLYLEETDTIRIGLEHASTDEVTEHLCPYSNDNVKYATSFKAMKKRIDVVDKIIKQCVTL